MSSPRPMAIAARPPNRAFSRFFPQSFSPPFRLFLTSQRFLEHVSPLLTGFKSLRREWPRLIFFLTWVLIPLSDPRAPLSGPPHPFSFVGPYPVSEAELETRPPNFRFPLSIVADKSPTKFFSFPWCLATGFEICQSFGLCPPFFHPHLHQSFLDFFGRDASHFPFASYLF